MAGSTTVTTYGSAISRIDQKELLAIAEGMLGAEKFAIKNPVAKGAGGTYRVTKIVRPAKVTTTQAFGVANIATYSSANPLTANHKDITPVQLRDAFSFDDDVDIKSWIKEKDNKAAIAGQVARSHDAYTLKKLALGGFWYRIDGDATYMWSGGASGGSTTTLADSGVLTAANDTYEDGAVTWYNPEYNNYDETRLVTDSAQSGATVTFDAVSKAVASGDPYHICRTYDIAATDKLSVAGLLKASALHRKFETEKFSGGLYRAFIDPAQEADLWSDTTFLNSAIYDSSDRFKNYRLGRWLDIEFMVTSELYTSTAGSTSATVYHSPVFGANAYAIMRWGHGSGDFGVKFYETPEVDSGNIFASMRILSWKSVFAAEVLRATSVINLMTGATSLAV